jgi:predicted transcriptional regulator
MPREHLTLLDLSDREFLLVVMDASDGDGWADSQDIANLLDVERRNASSRLSWLVRWGVVEREHKRDESGNLRYHRDGKSDAHPALAADCDRR